MLPFKKLLDDGKFEFLIYGGDYTDYMTMVFETSMADFKDSKFQTLQSYKEGCQTEKDLLKGDGFNQNQSFAVRPEQIKPELIDKENQSLLLHQECNLVAVTGQAAIHIFDKQSLTWVAAIPSLGRIKQQERS